MKRSVVAAGLSLLAACLHQNGRLETNRFQHENYPYAVFYTPEGSPLAPLGGAWRVTNFSLEPDGRYAAKTGPEHEVVREFDLNGDGQPDEASREVAYDLRLKHTVREASIWVSTPLIAQKERNTALRVLADRYLEAVSGSGSALVQLGAASPRGVASTRFASRVLHSAPCTVSKREALQVDFEVADVEQLAASESARWQRGRVVFVRTGYERRVTGSVAGKPAYADYPALLILGLAAHPQDFSTLEADFDTLLQRTVLGEVGQGLSMNGESSCGSLVQATASGGEAAPTAAAPEVEENEAAKIPLAPEAMPAPEATP